jgi:SAM-dependent methyltransferase
MDDPYDPPTDTGRLAVQPGGQAEELSSFRHGLLDFVDSSHLPEDYVETEAVLREWLRVLKPDGRLVIFCPDEPIYSTGMNLPFIDNDLNSRLKCTVSGQPLQLPLEWKSRRSRATEPRAACRAQFILRKGVGLARQMPQVFRGDHETA